MIRNGMGIDVRSALREKIALKVRAVVFMNTCHGEDGRFCETHGVVHGKSKGQGEGEDDPFGVSRPDKNRSRLGKLVEGSGVPGLEAEELAEIRKTRSKNVTSARLGFTEFPGEVGALRKQVNVDKGEVWLTKEEFLARKDGRGRSALERYAERDLHGLIVEQGGKYLDPFSSSHAVIRLHQTGMPRLINRVVKKVTGETALAVELKPGKVAGSRQARSKNRLYMVAGEKGGKQVALNVVILPDGKVQTAFLEYADGSYAPAIQVRKAVERAGVKIPNKVINVKDFR